MTHLVRVTIDRYNQTEAVVARSREMDPDVWAEIGKQVVFSDHEWPTFAQVTRTDDGYWSWAGALTVDSVMALQETGVSVQLGRIKGLFYDQTPAALVSAGQAVGSQIHIHVPGGVALTSVNKVDYLEDCCTDRLQELLNQGWIIIAVCPANDSRRPTYIIGRAER